MSKEICYRDQHNKLNEILEQVKALSDVVDQLRTELNDLRKLSLNANRDNVLVESEKVHNKIDHHIRPSVLQEVKRYLKNIRGSTKETCQLAKNNQAFKSDLLSPNYVVRCKRERNEQPLSCKSSTATGLSVIYDGLKFFKNKIVKTIQSVPVSQRSPRRTEDKCVTYIRQQSCLSQKEEKSIEFDKNTRNEYISKCIDASEESENSIDDLFASGASARAEVTVCTRLEEDDENSDYLPYRDTTKNNMQHNSPLSITSDGETIVHSNRITGELSPKSRAKRTFLRNKLKRYKKCSCGSRCPYALYKLPCDKYRCSVSGENTDDRIGELTLECVSFGEKNNFPKSVTADAKKRERRNGRHRADFGTDEASTSSSLSVELEVNVYSDYGNSEEENVDEFSKRRKARTYTVNRMSVTRTDDAIDRFETKTEPSSNVISSRRNRSEKKKRIDEIVEDILSQRNYMNLEENQQRHRIGTEDFANNHWLMKSNDLISTQHL